jgi:topoisomerase IA-like protein
MDEDEIVVTMVPSESVSLEEAMLLLGIPTNVWEHRSDG